MSLRKAPPGEMALYNYAGAMPKEDVDLSSIPEEYHEFIDLFSKKKADQLPPHGPYDHRIALMPGSKPPCGRVQRLSLAEGEELGMYIVENLKKGFIRHSQSEYGAPIVFTRKKDSTLRTCVDYRGLNKLTIKNHYPLPLIEELLDRMCHELVTDHRLRARLERSERAEARGLGGNRVNVGPRGRRLS